MRAQFCRSLRRGALPFDLAAPWDWDTLVTRLAEQRQGLCVLNTRAHARAVWEKFRQRVRDTFGEEAASGVIHLSSSLCAQHRLEVLGTRDTAPPGSVRD